MIEQPYVHKEYPKWVLGQIVQSEMEEAELLAAAAGTSLPEEKNPEPVEVKFEVVEDGSFSQLESGVDQENSEVEDPKDSEPGKGEADKDNKLILPAKDSGKARRK